MPCRGRSKLYENGWEIPCFFACGRRKRSRPYLNHINDEVHLYGLLHQLAFLAGRIKDEEDVFHVLDTAKRYGEIAEEKFQGWNIPGRYLVFGDPKDLKDLMARELAEATPVTLEEPAPKKYRDEYIIPGSGFRMLVGDIQKAGEQPSDL